MSASLAMNLLLIEDDATMAQIVATRLSALGHSVDVALSGKEGVAKAEGSQHDVLIVDRMLPEIDGLSIVRRLREAGDATPVIFLTTMDGIDDRVAGLEAGADDYLVKPFAMAELVARIAALGRRGPSAASQTILRSAGIEMDLVKRTVTRGGHKVDLQPREFQLLEYLMRNASQVVTRTMLLENVWDFHFDPQTNIVETHISRLRSKLDKGFSEGVIHTVRGVGYMLRDPG
jgi:two-component system, OmpR family, response regulator